MWNNLDKHTSVQGKVVLLWRHRPTYNTYIDSDSRKCAPSPVIDSPVHNDNSRIYRIWLDYIGQRFAIKLTTLCPHVYIRIIRSFWEELPSAAVNGHV